MSLTGLPSDASLVPNIVFSCELQTDHNGAIQCASRVFLGFLFLSNYVTTVPVFCFLLELAFSCESSYPKWLLELMNSLRYYLLVEHSHIRLFVPTMDRACCAAVGVDWVGKNLAASVVRPRQRSGRVRRT